MFKFLIPLLTVAFLNVGTAQSNESLSLAKIVKKPALTWPVDCDLNTNCWIYNYVDMIPDDELKTDPFCGAMTYDAHKGTDIAVLNAIEISKGINILAAADGTILRTRDNEPDKLATDEDIKAIKEARKECGNAVLIDHGDDLQTVYCHLKQGSITVKQGDRIKAGQKIAQMGLSGMTEFPHLHFGIIDNGKIIDPFTMKDNSQKCGKTSRRFWAKDQNIQPERLIINNSGFGNTIPTLQELDLGDITPTAELTQSIDQLIFWTNIYGLEKGDRINLEVIDPNLKPYISRSIEQEKTRARQLYYTGKKLTKRPPQAGVYTGTITVTRDIDGNEPQEWQKTQTLTILPQ